MEHYEKRKQADTPGHQVTKNAESGAGKLK